MKKWLFAWVIITAYLITNLTIRQPAVQPHLVATMLLGFFFFLIFRFRGVYGVALAVTAIVLLAAILHQIRQPPGVSVVDAALLTRLALDIVTILGGGGLGYWVLRSYQKLYRGRPK
ncbi:hypothetical protein [Tumebacillus lipolyticus]|uniref:VanZ-like domain-containing protein n=1 Tax=Tumebacillus lipolyticus TaxID=1280370 RepID=A0ABW4ZSR0_9BACL